jgi:hypothetical protein
MDLSRVSSHVEHRDHCHHLRLNDVEHREIALANDGPAEVLVAPGKHFRIPANPENCFTKFFMEFLGAPELPGFVESARVSKIVFDEFEELDREAPYRRFSRRSNSFSEIRLTFPAL